MIDIPINTKVECLDGRLAGWSTGVVLNPSTGQITYLIVKERKAPYTLRLVPIEQVLEAAVQTVYLNCTMIDIAKMAPFVKAEFIEVEVPPYLSDSNVRSYFVPEPETITIESEQIPPDELTICKGAKVETNNGLVGQVDGFLIEPANGFITHLVLRQGHLWGQTDITIPVSEINYFTDDRVYLKLSKQDIEALPAISIKKWVGLTHSAYYRKYPNSTIDPTSVVDEAEWESFPASDPPVWTSGQRR